MTTKDAGKQNHRLKVQNQDARATLQPILQFIVPSKGGGEATHEEGVAPRSSKNRKLPRLTEQVRSILNWPTDTVSIDYYDGASSKPKRHYPHTILVFIPGNPGCVGWYTGLLLEVVSRLGVGYAARGLSYAGHGTTPDICNVEKWDEMTPMIKGNDNRNVQIPWTVDGQIRHKIEYMNMIGKEMKELQRMWTSNHETTTSLPRYIFISHSIGSHMVQRLCVLRPDILKQTKLLIHLTPFIRMDAHQPQQAILTTMACSQNAVIYVAKALCRLSAVAPRTWVDSVMKNSVPDQKGRELAVGLIRQPTFAKNFFQLGTEEIRDVPAVPDDSALRIIGKQCPTAMLYCGGPDHWAPPFHMEDIQALQKRGCIPQNIQCTYMPELVHDFVVRPHMVDIVADYCYESISRVDGISDMRSKL